jgi:hypothetical protein
MTEHHSTAKTEEAPEGGPEELILLPDMIFDLQELRSVALELRKIFRAPDSPTLTPTVCMQLRYSLALQHLGKFLGNSGVGGDVVSKIDELARIFFALTEGVSHPCVTISAKRKGNDRPDIWMARRTAALAMVCLLKFKTRDAAAKFAEKNAPNLNKLVTQRSKGKGGSLKSSLLTWHDSFCNQEVSDFQSQDAFTSGLPMLRQLLTQWEG